MKSKVDDFHASDFLMKKRNFELSSNVKVNKHTCIGAAFCMRCPYWLELQQKMIAQNLFDSKFFECKEFRFARMHRAMCLFCSRFDDVISKEEIFEYVWPDTISGSSRSNVCVLIYDLRNLLIGQDISIISIRGVGYQMKKGSKL